MSISTHESLTSSRESPIQSHEEPSQTREKSVQHFTDTENDYIDYDVTNRLRAKSPSSAKSSPIRIDIDRTS
jgi:hypothetical protein